MMRNFCGSVRATSSMRAACEPGMTSSGASMARARATFITVSQEPSPLYMRVMLGADTLAALASARRDIPRDASSAVTSASQSGGSGSFSRLPFAMWSMVALGSGTMSEISLT